MKTSVVVSVVLVSASFAIIGQPKYTNVTTNQSAFVVQNLDGYKETGSKLEDRNCFMNPSNYKNSVKVNQNINEYSKPSEAITYTPALISRNNYKSQFKSSDK